MAALNVSRRGLLGGLGVLVLGLHLPCDARQQPVGDGELNAFVAIAADGTITVFLPSSEMGQGINTALPMVVAEELDADWTQVRAEHAPAARDYQRPLGPGIRMQLTGGSQTIIAWREPMAEAGASARDLLVRAAALRWDVEPSACTTEASVVRCGERSATYGELAAEASVLRPSSKVTLKPASAYRIVGTPVPRSDLHAKVTGKAVFGADVRLPGMRYATVVACPVFGGQVGKVDDAATRAIPGVRDVLVFADWVAVVADGWWAAKKGVDALVVTWDDGPNVGLDSAGLSARLHEALDGKASVGRKEGKALDALGTDAIEAIYEVPYLDHAPMEPMNCTVHVRPGAVEIWAPTQAQTLAQNAGAKITGYDKDQVTVHTTLLGGGFGRRGQIDYVEQAVHVGMAVDGPVQVMWTREECFRHGFYRPAFVARMRGKVAEGRPSALHIRLAGDNVLYRWIPKILRGLSFVQDFGMEGLLESCPYTIENHLVDYVPVETPVPIGFWRSVGYSHNAFFIESFVDELAHAAKVDPVDFRRAMLGAAPRYLAVLERAVAESGWGRAPAGRFQGVALHESFGSIVAEVAEISIDGGRPRVHRVTAAVDCGPVVNPGIVKTQIMGGVIYGLSAAMGEKISLEQGRVVTTSFAQYPLLRMVDAPEVDVHIIDNPTAPTGGIGEVGTPPVAPAVCNAIFAASGKRIRRLPLLEALETA